MIKISDLGLVTSLFTLGYRIESLEKTDSPRVNFLFEESDEIEEDIKQYWNGALLVPALSYYQNIKVLKVRITQS